MRRLGRGIAISIVEEFGPEEFLKRLSDPVWFQSLGCVMGFDWNSSGLTVTTLGALKAGLFDIQDQLGVYVCGGKDATPFPVNLPTFDKTIELLERGIQKSRISNQEKIEAQRRLTSFRPSLFS